MEELVLGLGLLLFQEPVGSLLHSLHKQKQITPVIRSSLVQGVLLIERTGRLTAGRRSSDLLHLQCRLSRLTKQIQVSHKNRLAGICNSCWSS